MNDIEQRLHQDAQNIPTQHSDTDGRTLLARVRATPQVDAMPATQQPVAPRTRATWWVSGAMVCAAMLIALLMPGADDVSNDRSTDYITPVAGTDGTPPNTPIALSESLIFEQVSRAVALEEEWIAIQDDVARAKAQLEETLPVGF